MTDRYSAVKLRKGAIGGIVVLALLVASGPERFAQVVGFISSLITWPFTRELITEANRYEIRNAEILFVYIVAVLGLNLFFQVGYKSIGQSAPMLVGAYTFGIATTTHELPFLAGLLLAVVGAGLLSLLLGLPALRLGVFTLAMVTIGYSFVAEDLVFEWRGITGGGNGLSGISRPSTFDTVEDYYWVLAIAAVLALVFTRNWLRSELGRAGKAVADNQVAARSLGVNLQSVKLRAFAVAGAMGGLAGALYAPLYGFIAPEGFTVDLSILFVLMVLLGGSGTVWGPLLGAVVLFRIPLAVEEITDQPGEWSLAVYGLVLVLSVSLLPNGLMSFIRGLRRGGESQSAGMGDASVAGLIDGADASVGLKVEGCSFGIGGLQILKGVDLDAAPGKVTAIIGPNGSGKTTLLNVSSGFLSQDDGVLSLGGADISRASAEGRARSGLARTFQTPLLFEQMTCLDNVLVGLDQADRRLPFGAIFRTPGWRRRERAKIERATAILVALGLGPRLDTAAGSLTPGERRLLEIGRVVAMEPSLILMDEPAAGLTDGEISVLENLIEELRAHGVGVILVEHHVDMVMRLADHVIALDFGEVIASGDAESVRNHPDVVRAYFGDDPEGELATPVEPSTVGGTEDV